MAPLLPLEYVYVVAAQTGNQNEAAILGWADT
jgi:hypothetical protein